MKVCLLYPDTTKVGLQVHMSDHTTLYIFMVKEFFHKS